MRMSKIYGALMPTDLRCNKGMSHSLSFSLQTKAEHGKGRGGTKHIGSQWAFQKTLMLSFPLETNDWKELTSLVNSLDCELYPIEGTQIHTKLGVRVLLSYTLYLPKHNFACRTISTEYSALFL